MPPESKVFVVEDDKNLAATIKAVLKFDGHQVVGMAHTRESALASAKTLQSSGVDVVTMDGNLDDPKDTSGNDGRDIVRAIREFSPSVKIVGLSGTGGVEGADVSLEKSQDVLLNQLGKTVTNL